MYWLTDTCIMQRSSLIGGFQNESKRQQVNNACNSSWLTVVKSKTSVSLKISCSTLILWVFLVNLNLNSNPKRMRFSLDLMNRAILTVQLNFFRTFKYLFLNGWNCSIRELLSVRSEDDVNPIQIGCKRTFEAYTHQSLNWLVRNKFSLPPYCIGLSHPHV